MKKLAKTDSKIEFKNIDINKVVGFKENPNEMSDKTFNRLVKEIETVGFIEPILVVPGENDEYRVVGGHQRLAAARVVGLREIPAIILRDEKFQDVNLQKLLLVRLNMLRGKINPEKFLTLYEQMAEVYGEKELQDLFAVTDTDEWKRLTQGLKKSLVEAGIPVEIAEQIERSDLKTIDGLSTVLNEIFQRYGDTLQYDFIVFKYLNSDKKILYIEVTKEVFRYFENKLRELARAGIRVNDWLTEVIKTIEEKDAKGLNEL